MPPEHLAGARIERHDDAPRQRHVHHAVHHDRRRLVAAADAGLELPRETERRDVVAIDLGERREALLVVGASVRQPVARLGVGGLDACAVDGRQLPCAGRRARLAGGQDQREARGHRRDRNRSEPCPFHRRPPGGAPRYRSHGAIEWWRWERARTSSEHERDGDRHAARNRQPRRGRGPGRQAVGRADPAIARALQHRPGLDAARDDHGVRHPEEGRRQREPRRTGGSPISSIG